VVNKRKRRGFVERERIRAAIEEAERFTTARICVSIAPHFWGDVPRTARRAMKRQGLTRSRERNGVLFFVVPSRRVFVIVGDAGAEEKIPGDVWTAVAALVQEHFRAGDPTTGLERGVAEIGRHLALHFPERPEEA
jgi:uncharacterized membrane protein